MDHASMVSQLLLSARILALRDFMNLLINIRAGCCTPFDVYHKRKHNSLYASSIPVPVR